jgi:uncharacterized protein YwgA
MLTCENAILVAIDAGEGIGRTALQKVIFFAKELQLTEAAYNAHYYGPYSREVASTLLSLVAAGWVEESGESWPDGSMFGERRRYAYRLTAAGRSALQQLVTADNAESEQLRKVVRLCKEKTYLDFEMLSWAAKIRFMVAKLNKPLNPEQIEEQARAWGWQVNQEDVPKVADLLDSLQLAKPAA